MKVSSVEKLNTRKTIKNAQYIYIFVRLILPLFFNFFGNNYA